MEIHDNKSPIQRGFLAFICGLSLAACNAGGNSDLQYKTAINQHFKAFPACIWSQAKKFPVQAATADDAKTQEYDALTQEGLLTRTTAEKKVSSWLQNRSTTTICLKRDELPGSPDSSQPGYGNFCYGNREVTSIDNSTLGTNGVGAKTVDVTYRYQNSNVPAWARSQEMQTAYPNIASAHASNASDKATLVMTGDHWEYTP